MELGGSGDSHGLKETEQGCKTTIYLKKKNFRGLSQHCSSALPRVLPIFNKEPLIFFLFVCFMVCEYMLIPLYPGETIIEF